MALQPTSDALNQISSFLKHVADGTKIALVTSGGTTVPLESRTVRFIDNFSSGSRGSTSAENFLHSGYYVIFLHRRHSLKPFDRQFSHSTLDNILTLDNDAATVRVDRMQSVHQYLEAKSRYKQSLLMVEFTSVTQYLQLLQLCCECLARFKCQVFVYLAAAVSDFYIPDDELPEHKIQSSGGPLNLQLKLVPKALKTLVSHWIPEAYIASFKLETDESLLCDKSKKALQQYCHNMVIANILETRREIVWLFEKDKLDPLIVALTPDELQLGLEIESKIVLKCSELHGQFINLKSLRT